MTGFPLESLEIDGTYLVGLITDPVCCGTCHYMNQSTERKGRLRNVQHTNRCTSTVAGITVIGSLWRSW